MNDTALTVDCKPKITINRPVPRMVGIKEAHDVTGLSEPFLRRGFKSGELVGVRCGATCNGKILLNLDKLIDYLNSHTEQVEPAHDEYKAGGISPVKL